MEKWDGENREREWEGRGGDASEGRGDEGEIGWRTEGESDGMGREGVRWEGKR